MQMNQIQAAALSILGKKKKDKIFGSMTFTVNQHISFQHSKRVNDIHCKPAHFIPTQQKGK